jgi:integration host factor subunit beta
VIKSELVRALNEKLPELQLSDVDLAVNCLLEQMADALIQGKRIEIRGFGSFDLHHRPPRIGRNPKTGAAVNLPAKIAVHFKPGKEMRDRVNAAHNPCGITE